jgi:hypothetical protein
VSSFALSTDQDFPASVKEEFEIEGFTGEQKSDLISFHICCNTQSTPMLHITQGNFELHK